MLKYILIYTLIACSFLNLEGQNLVENGDFEEINHKITVKVNQSCSVSAFNKMFSSWKTHKSSPDIWNENYMKWGIDTILVKNQGNFIGLAFGKTYSENIHTHFVKLIKKGKFYKFSMNIGMANHIPHTGHPPLGKPTKLDTSFGLLFSSKIIKQASFLLGKPHINFDYYEITPGLWTKITGYFESNKDYSSLTIGQFDERKGELLVKSNKENVYFFIDDISLVEVDSMPKEKPKVIPPSPVVNIQKDTFTINGILFFYKNEKYEIVHKEVIEVN